MGGLSKFFIYRPIFAMVISIVIVIAGGVSLTTLPISKFPEITPPTVQVTAFYPGANAQVIANRQNQGGQATTERINAVQENSLMFDNDWLIAYGLQNPVLREAIIAS